MDATRVALVVGGAAMMIPALVGAVILAVRWWRAVRADDHLVDALRDATDAHDDTGVAARLSAWRDEVDATPIPPVDLDTAVRTVREGHRDTGADS